LTRAPAGAWVGLHPWTCGVLRASNRLHRLSKGRFDIRCGSALAAWGLLPGTGVQGPLASGAPVQLKGSQARRRGPQWLDLGGIAKGFAVDQAASFLKGLGLEGSVNAGGDLRQWGSSAPVEIRGGRWGRRLALGAGSLATSSVQARRVAGRRRAVSAHVDGRSGRPLLRPLTVAVLSRTCLQADALTKVVLLSPVADARRCLQAARARALVFGADGRLLRSLA
jgi:thiamine biosynthesis lipoprotein